jgi:hypothetical protein
VILPHFSREFSDWDKTGRDLLRLPPRRDRGKGAWRVRPSRCSTASRCALRGLSAFCVYHREAPVAAFGRTHRVLSRVPSVSPANMC